MNIRHIKLGTQTEDTASGLKGMVTHLQIAGDQRFFYSFQPRGLNPETQQPVKTMWITPDRLSKVVEKDYVDEEIPTEVLGTPVEDNATGFAGIATGVVLFQSGCVHIEVQPKGKLDKTGGSIGAVDFDIRRLSGKAIPKMDEEEKAQDRKKKPSPEPFSAFPHPDVH